jgi:hypothetical protein
MGLEGANIRKFTDWMIAKRLVCLHDPKNKVQKNRCLNGLPFPIYQLTNPPAVLSAGILIANTLVLLGNSA